MKTKLKQYEVDTENPFSNGDPLKRKPLVDDFVSLINQLEPPFVMAIDAPWGSGKTTFVKMLQAVLEEENKNQCIYFNAWETDFSTDPLISFVGELKQLLQSNDINGKECYNRVIKETGKILGKRALQTAAHYVSGGLVNEDACGNIADVFNAKYDHKAVGIMVDAYEEEKDRIRDFRTALEKYIAGVTDTTNKTVVIFVDELDRCRPTYAVELLERMKHLFNIKNVIFILSLHKEQLGVSLGAVYGQGIDSDKYLRRFIDLEYRLILPSAEAFTDYLIEKYEIKDAFVKRSAEQELNCFRDIFILLSDMFKLDLRTREQCFTRVVTAIMQTGKGKKLTADVVVILTIVRAVAPEVYFQYVSEKGSAKEIINFFESKIDVRTLTKKAIVAEIYALIILTEKCEVDPPDLCSPTFNNYYQKARGNNSTPEIMFAKQVVSNCNHFYSRGYWDMAYVIKRMDITE